MVIEANAVINAAANLIGPEERNYTEYDRGVANMVMDLVGLQGDVDMWEVVGILRKEAQKAQLAGKDSNRAKLDLIIAIRFPEALGVFYSENDEELAVVESRDGDLWRVWTDGDTEQYRR